MGPDFLGIGAHKAGTTWLHQILGLHPEIGLPTKKELHFWDKLWPAQSIDSYERMFAEIDRPIRGEITPAYAILPPATIQVIHDHYPALKLIYILRNPLERAWSHARMGYSKYFDDSVPDVLASRHDWFIEHFHSEDSLLRGDYETCVRNWLTRYPRKQLLLRMHEELVTQKQLFLEECGKYLGANSGYFATLESSIVEQRIYPESAMHNTRPSALPSCIPQNFIQPLLQIYTSRILALSNYLGQDLVSLWLTPYRGR